MTRPSIARLGRVSFHLLAAGYLGACGSAESSDDGAMGSTPSTVARNLVEICIRAAEIVDPSLEMGGFIFPDKPDPRSQSLDATSKGIDCAVIRSDGSFAQLFVPDNGETPFIHEVDP